MTDLQDRLRLALADRYAVKHELTARSDIYFLGAMNVLQRLKGAPQ